MRPKAVLTIPLAVALLGATPLPAQQPGREMNPRAEPTIRVSGLGEVRVAPDEAHLDFAVETSAATANTAAEQNAAAMERVIQALVGAGVRRSDIETRNYSVYPEHFQPQPNAEPRIRGYRVSNTVSLTTRDLARVGSLLDVALRAGANRVDAVRFGLSDPGTARTQAIRRAVESARRDAEAMAGALGVRLGPVVDASTTAAPPHFPEPVMMRARAEAMDVATTPIQPGEQTVAATVTLVFAIER
ncbi:MAG TPA: SIMPL domain-containing protein [Longimicrobiaceae bacterium]|nr:SIMPL domain-containing protein [Longimicrobiaceae bacterium]